MPTTSARSRRAQPARPRSRDSRQAASRISCRVPACRSARRSLRPSISTMRRILTPLGLPLDSRIGRDDARPCQEITRPPEATMNPTPTPAVQDQDMQHRDWMTAATEEYRRLGALLEELPDDEWHTPTDCSEWDVREMVAHLVGAAEAAA